MSSRPMIADEARRLVGVAAPLIAAYVAELLMFVTTKLVVGGLGYKQLAAVGLAGSLTFEMCVIAMGFLSITGVLAAQAEGAGKKADAGRAARQGLILATLISIPLSLAVWNFDAVMRWTGQDEAVIDIARPFLHVMAFYIAPTLWFTVLRDFIAALARTRIIMWATLVGVAVNWALAEGLAYGRWGLPEMGVAGAGWAIVIAHVLMVVIVFAYIWRTPALRGYGLFKQRLRVIPAIIGEITRLGLPVAGLVAVEAGMFTAVGILSGVISAEALAAHQILMSWIGFPFVVALALAEGTMVRVAHGVGRGDPAGARAAGFLGLGMGAGVLSLAIVAPVLLADQITQIFIAPETEGYAAVAAVAAQLMLVAAIFQVFDGVQVIAARALRALKDAYAPLWIGAVCYWPIGIGGGALLAFGFDMGAAGLWTGLAMGLTVAAFALVARFAVLARRLATAPGAVGDAPQAGVNEPPQSRA